MEPSQRPPTTTRIQRIYYSTGALFTLATSIIWGVNTLFLLDAGLDIFRVMLVNATFSAGQIVFEVPTGVIADTVGRRVSFLLGIGTLMIATLGYVGSAVFSWGLPGFILSSVLLGFGYTCQTGAVDAWLVDALDSTGYSGSKDRVFARNGMFNGISMLVGTLGGGLLGQLSLAVPYLVRTGLLLGAFALTAAFMRDLGFQPRPLKVARIGEESRKIFGAGITHGWRHPVIRPLLFASLVNGLLVWYLFYASQPYALELLGRKNLVWVAGLVTALFALSGVAGNSLVGPISRTRIGSRPASVLVLSVAGMATLAAGIGVTGLLAPPGGHVAAFAVLIVLLGGFGLLMGLVGPVRQAYINEHIPSAQRATVLSFDSFFGDVGAVGGQLGLGYAAQAAGKALAYTVGGAVYFISVPLYRRAGRASDREVKPLGDASAGGLSPVFEGVAGAPVGTEGTEGAGATEPELPAPPGTF
jgi:MFS family permease